MRYLVVDGELDGTGIRDKYNGFVSPKLLGLSDELCRRLARWLKACENEHYMGYQNESNYCSLDNAGIELARNIFTELNGMAKVEYYSNARQKYLVIGTVTD